MSKAQVGSGRVGEFGKMSGASLVPGNNTDQTKPLRENSTRRVYSTKCEYLHGPLGPGLAGGNSARFEQLRKHSAGNTPDAGVHGEKDWDALPGQSGT